MNIAVNTRLLLHNRLDGWGRFAYEVLKPMVLNHPEHKFIFFFDRAFHPEFVFAENITPVVLHPQARHPWLWHIWFEWMLPRALNAYQADVFLSPDGYLSMASKVPALPVIHDLNFYHNPLDLPAHHSTYLNRNFPLFAKKATRIATVSEFSKQDIVTQYGISPDKIDVVYNGVSERFKPTTVAEQAQTRQKWSNGKPYFIYVGALHPRKNIARMLRAFDQFREASKQEYKLILVGNRQWWTEAMESALAEMTHKEDVIFTGRVEEEDLQQLLGAAFASLYVSTFEGFGIPIIEAFQAGVPVITSNVSAMPEVAGDGALLVNPMAMESVAEAMLMLSTQPQLREDLIAKGKVQAKQFTWQRSSELLWNSILKVKGEG
jgi:glycosyltransferase involved in cell wall biosynthesis